MDSVAAEREAQPFVYRREVRFYETDMVGIVHFSNFFRIMEEAELAFWKSLGVSLFEPWNGSTISFPRVSAKCDFKSSARFDDAIDTAVTIVRVGKSSVTFAFDLRVGARQVAVGEIVACCCVIHPDRPPKAVRIPPPILEKLGR